MSVILLLGCKMHHKNNSEYKSVDLEKDDPSFLALKDTAQAHMKLFVDSVNAHGHDIKQYIFALKSDYVDKGTHEHMWSRIFSYQNGVFKGVFADSAYRLKNIKFDDSVSVKTEDVEDWSVHNSATHKTIGNFSEEYLKSKMKNSEKK